MYLRFGCLYRSQPHTWGRNPRPKSALHAASGAKAPAQPQLHQALPPSKGPPTLTLTGGVVWGAENSPKRPSPSSGPGRTWGAGKTARGGGKLPGVPRGGRAARRVISRGTVPTLTGQRVQTQPECSLAPPSSARAAAQPPGSNPFLPREASSRERARRLAFLSHPRTSPPSAPAPRSGHVAPRPRLGRNQETPVHPTGTGHRGR